MTQYLSLSLHPHIEDPSLLIATREGTEQKIIIKRLGPGKFQWQELMSEGYHYCFKSAS